MHNIPPIDIEDIVNVLGGRYLTNAGMALRVPPGSICMVSDGARTDAEGRADIRSLLTAIAKDVVALERKRIASFLAENAANIAASSGNACQNAATAYRDAKIALEKALAESERVQAAAVIQEEHADNLRKLAASLDP